MRIPFKSWREIRAVRLFHYFLQANSPSRNDLTYESRQTQNLDTHFHNGRENSRRFIKKHTLVALIIILQADDIIFSQVRTRLNLYKGEWKFTWIF